MTTNEHSVASRHSLALHPPPSPPPLLPYNRDWLLWHASSLSRQGWWNQSWQNRCLPRGPVGSRCGYYLARYTWPLRSTCRCENSSRAAAARFLAWSMARCLFHRHLGPLRTPRHIPRFAASGPPPSARHRHPGRTFQSYTSSFLLPLPVTRPFSGQTRPWTPRRIYYYDGNKNVWY